MESKKAVSILRENSKVMWLNDGQSAPIHQKHESKTNEPMKNKITVIFGA